MWTIVVVFIPLVLQQYEATMWTIVVFITKRRIVVMFNCCGKTNTTNFLNEINICPLFPNAGFTCRASSKEMFCSTTNHNIGTRIDQHVVTRTTLFTHSAFSGHTSSAQSNPPPPPTRRVSLNLFIVDGNVLRLHLSYPVTTCWRHPDWLSTAYEVLTFSIAATFQCRFGRARGAGTEETGTSSQTPVSPTECYNLTAYIWLFEDRNYYNFI